MPYAFNIMVILLVGLIAYWWANQGLLSAILHLLCVIVAGAVAFAVWEPLTTGLLLRNTPFDDYAWGVSLVSVFALVLLVLRVTLDKTVRGNVDLPQWAHLAFGFPLGAVAGIITIGIVLIGAGHIQSGRDILGVKGTVRAATGRTVSVQQVDGFWLPVHQLTDQFYSWLSVTSLYPTFYDTPMAHLNPDIHVNAISLLRDSAAQGRGKLALRPADARIERMYLAPDANRCLVQIRFEAGARDFGEQLTLSQAQIRLIGAAGGVNEARYVFPVGFKQHSGRHLFDDLSHYVTSQPGQQQADVVLEFDTRELRGAVPKYIQIRNTRYLLPRQGTPQFQAVSGAELGTLMGGPLAITSGAGATPTTVDTAARKIDSLIEVSNDIRPINASINIMPGSVKVTEQRFISEGDGVFPKGGQRVSRALGIEGIHEPEGTRIVKLDISRGKAADIFGPMRDRIGEDGVLQLIDSQGRGYRPIGFMHDMPEGKIRIKVDFLNFSDTPAKLPPLPTSGAHTLKLLFSITEGSTIVGFKGGDITVGTCNLPVPAKVKRS